MRCVTIIRGQSAVGLLRDPTFTADWAQLCDRCPWSTSYQLPAFAGTWYRVYAEGYESLLVTSRKDSGALSGLMCLAAARSGGEPVFAGASQSEYQTWISDPEIGDEFALAAALAIRAAFPSSTLEFRYLPPSAPLQWLTDPRIRSGALLTEKRRPLLRFAEMSADSLRKTNNKKRLKGLKKLGELEFARLRSPEQLAAILDHVALFHDLRQLAMHGLEPFAGDPMKKQFHLELMKEPGLLHVTALKAGDQLAAAQINLCDRKQIHLNLMTYNPMLARHSPGKFHIHMLSQMLVEEGFEDLDLTPGGDPYKERFANTHDAAYVLRLFPTRTARLRGLLRDRMEQGARKALGILRIHPARAKAAWEAVKEARSKPFARLPISRIGRALGFARVTDCYTIEVTPNRQANEAMIAVGKDAIEDLMKYRRGPGEISRKRFLFAAMNRLEEGQRAFTTVEDGRLRHVGWLMERPTEAFAARTCPGVSIPPNHALIVSLISLCPEREAAMRSACLTSMLGELGRAKGVSHALIVLSPSDRRLRSSLEARGFRRIDLSKQENV
jgi:CelD/BcsL family acetyltransferase involved in cellulose biosynthesis